MREKRWSILFVVVACVICLMPSVFASPERTLKDDFDLTFYADAIYEDEPNPEEALLTEGLTYEDYALSLIPDRERTEIEEEIIAILYGYYCDAEELIARAEEALSSVAGRMDYKNLRALETEIDRMCDKLDRFENTLRASYRAKDLDLDQYKLFLGELNRIDDELDWQEDRLEDLWDDDDDDDDD